jgi:hypothetical protein
MSHLNNLETIQLETVLVFDLRLLESALNLSQSFLNGIVKGNLDQGGKIRFNRIPGPDGAASDTTMVPFGNCQPRDGKAGGQNTANNDDPFLAHDAIASLIGLFGINLDR